MSDPTPSEATTGGGTASERAPGEAAIRERLDEVIDPCSAANGSNLSVLEMGLLDEVRIEGDHVHVDMHVTSPHCMMTPVFVDEVTEKVDDLPGVESVSVDFDAGMEWSPRMITEEGQAKRERAMAERTGERGTVVDGVDPDATADRGR